VTADDLPLPTLLSRLLIAFTTEFDNEAEHRLEHRTTRGADGGTGRGPWLVSQAMWANFMQFVPAAGILTRRSCAVAGPDPAASRGKVIRLTPRGRSAQEEYLRLLDAVEQRWRTRFGPAAIDTLRRSLLSVTGQRDDGRPRLALGLRPYPDGWRARGPYLRQTTAVLNDPGAALPHYPMVRHRGGWPDGS
jgi:hypothetical protein